MNFLAEWFNPILLIAALLSWIGILALTAKSAFTTAAHNPIAVMVSAFSLTALWYLNAGIGGGQLAGMSYHLIGINLVVLMLGAPAALWLGTLLLIPYIGFNGTGNLMSLGLNALFLLLPAVSINILFRRIATRLPANLFIYIFLNGFLAAAAGMLLTGLCIVLLLETVDAFTHEVLWTSAFPVFFLLSWGEAFLNGIFTAIFVALKPQWLVTFEDSRYLQSHNQIWK